MRSWIYLFIAIVAEVIGTTSMKFAATQSPLLGHALMYSMIGLSYGFLALAVKRVPLGVAYALWEGIGIVLINPGQHHLAGREHRPAQGPGSGRDDRRYPADQVGYPQRSP